MGKKKNTKNTSKKGKALLSPEAVEERNNVINFLKDMFPSIDEGIVRMIYDENEHDQEKTITQLSALSETNDLESTAYNHLDDQLCEDYESITITSSNKNVTPQTSPPVSARDKTPKKETQVETITKHTTSTPITITLPKTDILQTQPTEKKEKQNFQITSNMDIFFEDDFMERWACLLEENPITIKNDLESSQDEGFDFIKTSFTEMDTNLLKMIYEENGFDIEQTVEHVLSLLFINSMENENPDNVSDDENQKFKIESDNEYENEDIENDFEIVPNLNTPKNNTTFKPQIAFKLETLSEEELSSDSDNSEERNYEFENYPTIDDSETSPRDFDENGEEEEEESKSEDSNGLESLTLLTEMFPMFSRQTIVKCAEENDWDIEKIVDILMQKTGGSPPLKTKSKKDKKKKKKKKKTSSANNNNNSNNGVNENDSADEKTSDNIGRYGGKKGGKRLIATPNYSKFGKPEFKAKNLRDSKEYPKISPTNTASSSNTTTTTTTTISPPNSPDSLDMASKIKLQELQKMFVGTLPLATLQDVFLQCGKKVSLTLEALYTLVPSKNLNVNKNKPDDKKEEQNNSAQNKNGSQNNSNNHSHTSSSSSSSNKQQKNKEAQTTTPTKIAWDKVEIKKKPANVNKPEYVHSSQQVSSYDQYRKVALNYSVARNQCFRLAAQAYARGMNVEATNLRERARSYDKMAQDSRLDAVRQLFYDNNNLREGILTIDLHGFLAQEALEVIDEILDLHRRDPRNISHLSVITGRGLHSRGGVAKIKPAVQNYFRQKEYHFSETNPGSILVKLMRYII